MSMKDDVHAILSRVFGEGQSASWTPLLSISVTAFAFSRAIYCLPAMREIVQWLMTFSHFLRNGIP